MVSMWPHQEQLLLKMRQSGGRHIVADEVGTGKTRPILQFLKDNQSIAVIFVPYNIVAQVWKNQAQQWLGVEAIVFTGKPEERDKLHTYIQHRISIMHLDAERRPVVVVAHMYHHQYLLEHFKWSAVIYDEAHTLGFGNRKSKAFTKAKELMKPGKPRHLLFVTGTPYGKNLGDLWPMLHLIDKTVFRGYWNFVNEHCVVSEDFLGYKQIAPEPKNIQKTAQVLKPFMTRRTLRSVRADIPPVLHDVVEIEMDGRQKELYNQLVEDNLALFGDDEQTLVMTPNAISNLVRLRQVLVSPNIFDSTERSIGAAIPAAIEQARVFIENGFPTAIFTPFRLAAELIYQYVVQSKIVETKNIYVIQGGDQEKTMLEAERFQANPTKAKILIGTISSAISYTATEARKGIVVGAEYNHRAMQQMVGRLDRANQAVGEGIDPIQFVYFKHKGTVEEKVYARIQELQAWSDFTLNRENFAKI